MKFISVVAIIFLLSGCGTAQVKDEPVSNGLPTSLEAAVDQIVNDLSEEDKKTVKETKFDDLILYHHGWGTGIRNSFGLWRGNTELLKSACGSAECHPDDASMEIIHGVWNILNGNDYRYKPESENP